MEIEPMWLQLVLAITGDGYADAGDADYIVDDSDRVLQKADDGADEACGEEGLKEEAIFDFELEGEAEVEAEVGFDDWGEGGGDMDVEDIGDDSAFRNVEEPSIAVSAVAADGGDDAAVPVEVDMTGEECDRAVEDNM
ncbi:hypothetical protein BGX26_000590 [Mortierella sp. AD094]|nr:hypothetical protein BGX26_000590 [Mortierella sp. AD094]